MRLMTSILLALMLASCSNSSSTTIDAAPADAPNPDGSTDAALSVCTGKLYDQCNPAASNCMTGLMCKSFTGSAFSVCTQTCSTTCPNQGSSTVMCNNNGICKPNAPNTDCTSP